MRVLLTGSGGFTGRYVAERLRAAGCDVWGFVQSVANAPQLVQVDLTNAAQVQAAVQTSSPTHVIHLAALSFVGHGDARAFYDVNLFGTLNLLDALSQLRDCPKRVIVASSANVYGSPGVEVLDETLCPAPVNHYANSKLAMEHLAHTYSSKLPLVLVRPFNYTGIGQNDKFLIPKIVSHFRRRATIIELGNLDVARDFSDVRDVSEVYYRLLLSQQAVGETVNICSGQAHALRDILDMATELTGHSLEMRVNPALVRSSEVPRLLGNTAKLDNLIGSWQKIPLLETVRWMLME